MVLQKSGDARECFYEDLRHFFALQIARCQDKCRDACLHERQPFNVSIPDAMVFGQDNPAALPGLGKPVFILGIGGKVVVMDVKRGPA